MRFVLAPDSFKESLTAPRAAAAMATGVHEVYPEAECLLRPLSDGGEGFTQVVASAVGVPLRTVPVRDALGRPTRAPLALWGRTAVLDVASVVGLGMINPEERDLMHATTVGVGELVVAALAAGARRLIIGLGGSATNDGGVGMLARLGVRFLDTKGHEVAPYPAELEQVARLDASGLDPRLRRVEIVCAADVTNPLLGPQGASAVFGPQKGATAAQIKRLDAILAHLVELSPPTARRAAGLPGAGAAGGLGWALQGFTQARMEPGVRLVAELVDLPGACRGADVVFTGEGRVDAQTLAGKTVAGVLEVARTIGVPVVVFAGRIAPGAEKLVQRGVRDVVCITPPGQSDEQALSRAEENLAAAVSTWLRGFVGSSRAELSR